MDVTETEDFKKRWQEYTEELYQKHLHEPGNHDSDHSHRARHSGRWALGSITMNKASGDNGIPVELFQILKDDTVKVLHPICQQIWKTQPWLQDRKRSVSLPILMKGNAKEC